MNQHVERICSYYGLSTEEENRAVIENIFKVAVDFNKSFLTVALLAYDKRMNFRTFSTCMNYVRRSFSTVNCAQQ